MADYPEAKRPRHGDLPIITHPDLLARLRYDPETGLFWHRARRRGVTIDAPRGTVTKRGYRSINIGGRLYRAHRLAWFYVHGVWPTAELDHRNLDRDDNRIANLREATSAQNNANCPLRRTNTSGLKGANFDRRAKRWRAAIDINGRRIYLGHFPTKEQAHQAYAEAASRLHGEFARAA